MSTLQQNTHLHDLLQQLQAHLDEPLEDYLARQLNERHEAQPATNTIEPLYYRALFDNTSDAVFIIGPDERHIDANPRAAAMLGYTLDEIRGEEADYFLAPGEAADAAQRKQQLADSKTGALPTYERKFQRKDGTLINCEISPIMMRDSNGAITHIYSVVRDITERKQAEQSIRDSEQTAREFQAHLKTLHNLHFELARATTLDDIYRQAVTTGKNVLGFDRMGLFIVPEGTDMVMGTYGIAPDGSLRREYDYQTSMAQWQAAIATEHSAHDQPVLWQTDAHLVDYDTVIGTGWHGMAALWDGNDVRGYVAVDNLIGQRPPRPYDRELLAFFAQTVAHAITRRQRIAELELSEESIRLLLESAPSAIILLDSDSNIQRTNLSAREIFRYAEPDSLIGLNIEVLVPRVWDYLSRMYPHHDPNDDLAKPPHLGLANDLAGITEDGERIPIEMFLSTITINNEASMVCFINDLTEHVQLEKKRVELLLEKERGILMSSFIRDVSHEFKTPLSVIHTRTYLLRRRTDDPALERHFAMLDQQVDSINRLVDDLALMTRLEGMTRMKFYQHNALAVIQSTFAEFAETARARNIHINWDVARPVPQLRCDKDLLKMALARVVDNALRYSYDGGTLTVYCHAIGDDVVYKVIDEGVGIEPEHLPRLTERLYRVDTAHTTRGFGLGLSIADKIVTMHSGTLTVQSTPDEGTTVTIVLPMDA